MSAFTDNDLFFWENLTGNHKIDAENLEIHPSTLKDLLARLDASERIIALGKKSFTWDGLGNDPEFESAEKAWLKSKGEGKAGNETLSQEERYTVSQSP
jgi:hypothetical protein